MHWKSKQAATSKHIVTASKAKCWYNFRELIWGCQFYPFLLCALTTSQGFLLFHHLLSRLHFCTALHCIQVSSFKRRGQYLPSQHHADSWEGFIFKQNLECRPSEPTSSWNFSASNKFMYFSNWLVLENYQTELLFKMILYLLFKMSTFNPHFWQKFGRLDCISNYSNSSIIS